MKTVEELEALLETVNVERDDLKKRLLDMVFERNDVRDKLDICTLDLVTAKRERDEADADAEYLMHERDEARAEVERLRAGRHTRDCRKQSAYNVACVCGADGANRTEVVNAYRRGAEAMRDECIGAACGFFMGTTGFCNGDEDELEAVLDALPIPEEL